MMTINKSIQQKIRIPFIDTTKGFLIIFLVFHHIVNMAKDMMPIENLEFITQWDKLYVPYFMQAFFFITGYCSSFNKKTKYFLYSNAKSLLIPLLVFCILNQFFSWAINGDDFWFVTVLDIRFFFVTELYWFLSALFIAKILLFAITRISSKTKIQFALVLIPFVAAISLNTRHFHAYNWFHWHNGLVNLMFLWIGYTFKQHQSLNEKLKQYGIISLVLYFVGLIVCVVFDKNIPYYTHFPHFNIKYTPLFTYFSLTGTIMIIFIGSLLQCSKELSFLGRNTIVVYGVHFSILSIVIKSLSSFYVPNDHVGGLVFYLLTGGATLLISYWCCLLFQKSPFTYLIGKF